SEHLDALPPRLRAGEGEAGGATTLATRSLARNHASVNARRRQPTFPTRAKPSRLVRSDLHRRFIALVARADRSHRAHLSAIGRNPVYAGSRLARRIRTIA